MICYSCKKTISGESKFCRFCGTSIEQSRAPDTVPTNVEKSRGIEKLVPGSQSKRFFNYLIDFFVMYLMTYPFGYALGAFLAYTGINDYLHIENWDEQFLNYLVGFCLMFFYYLFMEWVWRKSIGKFITKTRVVSKDGSELTLGILVKRSASRLVPFEPFSFLGSRHPVGWHDKWSGTLVIED